MSARRSRGIEQWKDAGARGGGIVGARSRRESYVGEWLPANQLAWFVIDAVGEMDLDTFYAAYRCDGRSRPPYDPAGATAVAAANVAYELIGLMALAAIGGRG